MPQKRTLILIDATVDSQAPYYQRNPSFDTWLRVYDNVDEALKRIETIEVPYSIDVFVAKDNILDDGLTELPNGPMRTLIATLCDLNTVRHVTVFCLDVEPGLEEQIRCIMSNPRTLKDVVAINNLHTYMCTEGMRYLDGEIARYENTDEAHLIRNLREDKERLIQFLGNALEDQRHRLDAIEEKHSDRPGEEPS